MKQLILCLAMIVAMDSRCAAENRLASADSGAAPSAGSGWHVTRTTHIHGVPSFDWLSIKKNEAYPGMFGTASGEGQADANGLISIPRLVITAAPATLTVIKQKGQTP